MIATIYSITLCGGFQSMYSIGSAIEKFRSSLIEKIKRIHWEFGTKPTISFHIGCYEH